MVIQDYLCYNHKQIKRSFQIIPNEKIFERVIAYLEVGLPGALMLCFEWWLFEILAIFAGLMGVNELAAEVIIVNMAGFVFMIPLGCSFAASAFTGYFCASG